MKLSENIKPISYLKANAAEIIENLKATHQPMVITQNGEAAMVIQSVVDYEQTLETLALLKLLAQSQQAVNESKTVTSSEAFSKLRKRRGLQ
jgi:prevent-host-death family protein